ncbi:uncharacterized protein LOC141728848 [Zonotrichia albicollis]|uniref:uncharacterized protein LOC141728848 n=1 Tax=Zonotrichia albicollis TaxID=44394 RepID=UPI003D811DD5
MTCALSFALVAGASDGRFMSGERDAGPAAACSPCPACRAPPGYGGSCGTRERGSGSPALPRGRRQRSPAAPGNGAEARSSAPAERRRRETPSHSGDTTGFYPLLPTPSRSPQPRSTRLDSAPLAPTPSRSFGGSGTEPSVPGGGRSAPVPPPRPGPPRSAPLPLRRPGGLCPALSPAQPAGSGGREPGKPRPRGLLVRNAPKLPPCGDRTAGAPKARVNVKGIVLALRNPPPVH